MEEASGKFLAVTIEEIEARGIKRPDFILISGDAYVDHPSFSCALIGRVLESYGYSVLLNTQPNIDIEDDFLKYGEPKLAFLIASGNIESMVNNYYVSKKPRKIDEYSEGGDTSKRPDRALIKYSKKIRKLFPQSNIIAGGIEASLRRFAHYDYWSNSVMKSIIIDSECDLIVYGMGEETIVEVADYLKSGVKVNDLSFIKGTVFKTDNISNLGSYQMLPTYKSIINSKVQFMESFKVQQKNLDFHNEKQLVEDYDGFYVVQNPSRMPLGTKELDRVYDLPFTYRAHPKYSKEIPALKEILFSISINRGCVGNCNFCAITYHQGKHVRMRSKESVIKESRLLASLPDFKGYIHDVGGPTANFNDNMCLKLNEVGPCENRECIGFKKCDNLVVSHNKYIDVLRELRKEPYIKKVFIRSGIRYDYLLLEEDKSVFREIVKYHTSGQMRFAPEHVSNNVLKLMNKPPFHIYEEGVKKFMKITNSIGLEQYVLPYLISSHPGSTLEDGLELYRYLKKINFQPEQVQDFYPTPGTMSTVMYYTEMDTELNHIFVPKSKKDKGIQRALMQFRNPKYKRILNDVLKCERENEKLKISNKRVIKNKRKR